MFNYIAKKEGFKPVSFINRSMALSFINRGYIVEVYKNGKKIYVMCPVDKNEQ